MNRLVAFLCACMLLASPGAARSADCPERFRITFADGTRSCLTDHAIANDDVVGYFGADLRRVVPPSGNYSIAATPKLPQCKRAVGFSTSLGGSPATPGAYRNDKALQDCRLRARGATEACQCKLVLLEGSSPLSPTQFALYADDPPATASSPASAAAVSAPAAAPTGVAAGPAPVPTATPASPAPSTTTAGVPAADSTAAEIAALRQQLDSLRSDVLRSRTTAAEGPRKAQRVRALVIGNGRYANLGTLPNPPRDAQAIASKLRGYGIDVDLHLDVDRPGLVRALADFQGRAASYDVNLLFYAGHGLQVNGINYIVPVDMQTDGATVGTVRLNAVSLDDALDNLPAATRVVFLDACRDNPLSRSLRSTRGSVGMGLAPVSSVSGTLISYATRDGSTAEDGNGTNSPYTAALLQHLDAEEDIALVLRSVRQSVLKSTGQRQEPWEYGSLVGGQLVLSRLAR